MELIEAASKRYATLEKRLKSVAWKHHLRARPEFIQEVLGQEDALMEAIARTQRRGELEGWPQALPALEPLREVLRHRARVEGLIRKRLEELAGPTAAPALKTDLAHLEQLVRDTPSLEMAPGETRLLEMKRNQSIPPPLAVLIFLLVPFVHLTAILAGPTFLLFAVATFITLLAAFVMRAGEFWLTSDRLIWKPLMGEPVSVSLRSIRKGGIQMERLTRSMRVQGDRLVHVRYVEPLEKLAALLEMHRQPPFLGASRGGMRLAEVSYYPATLREAPGTAVVPGLAVLRPQGVSFLPLGKEAKVLGAITGNSPVDLHLELGWVVEELRWLPESEFDAHLARAVELTGGVHWSAWESRRNAGVPVWKQIHITQGAQSLNGKVDWSQQAAAERVFESWPTPS
jgi:hypothetical protein